MYHIQSSSYTMAFDEEETYSSSADSVDCTLSLGTPSTRIMSDDNNHHHRDKKRLSGWNIFSSSSSSSSKNAPPSASKTHRGNSGGDPLSARRCANCDTTSTPLWRNGPRGPKSLCNACGIRYKKEERRAMAAAAASGGGSDAHAVEAQYVMNNGSWTQWPDTTPSYPSPYQDDADATTGGVPFQSWPYSSIY